MYGLRLLSAKQSLTWTVKIFPFFKPLGCKKKFKTQPALQMPTFTDCYLLLSGSH